ncbi:MAG TPA: hypothetical protein VMP11_16280 [Verrucomicrobiae bacterium]|nr:hypothetical protein [Verrucomicrobiae bacterium]
MDSQRAREILAMYRPGIDDAKDPLISEALAEVRRDPELAHWLQQEQTIDAAVGRKFRQIPVPDGLEHQILAEHKVIRPTIWRRSRALLVAAAAAVVVLAVAGYWLRRPEPETFDTYRQSMAGLVSGDYKMMLETNDLNAVRQFLAAHHSPADYVLTKSMEELPAEGCALVAWHGRRVSLVCLDRGQKPDLFLFVVNRSALPGAPSSHTPDFARIGRMTTASWTMGDTSYVLASQDTEDDLRKFL